MRHIALIPLAAMFVVACDDQGGPLGPDVGAPPPAFDISDGQFGGEEHFFFLPPMVNQPSFSGEFNPNLMPEVRICPVAPTPCDPDTEAVLSDIASLQGNHYQRNWKTSKSDAGTTLRIWVLVGTTDLGYADARLESKPKGPEKPTDPSGDVVVKAGSTLPIKFRIENGALCENETDCVETTVGPAGGTKKTPSGEAGADFPAGALDEERTLIIELVDLGEEEECLFTARPQREGCYEFRLDPPLGAEEEFNFPVITGVCLNTAGLSDEQIDHFHLYAEDGNPVTNVVELENVDAPFLDCTEAFTDAGSGAFNLARRGLLALQRTLVPWINPPLAYAANIGRGGLASTFSRIGWAQESVLIYGPTETPTNSFRSKTEEDFAIETGHNAVVVAGATWAAKAADGIDGFGDFDAVVFGDGGGLGSLGDADASKTTWGPVITGPMVVSGLNPGIHQCDDPGPPPEEGPPVCLAAPPQTGGSIVHRPEAVDLIKNAINYATSGLSTGAYVSLGNKFGGESTPTTIDFLSGIGAFEAIGLGPTPLLDDDVTIVDGSHPVMAGLSDAGLSDWFASIHQFVAGTLFPMTLPTGFSVLAEGVRVTQDESEVVTEETLPGIIAR